MRFSITTCDFLSVLWKKRKIHINYVEEHPDHFHFRRRGTTKRLCTTYPKIRSYFGLLLWWFSQLSVFCTWYLKMHLDGFSKETIATRTIHFLRKWINDAVVFFHGDYSFLSFLFFIFSCCLMLLFEINYYLGLSFSQILFKKVKQAKISF